MSSPAKLLPALALLLAACGGPLLYGEVEIPRLGITLCGQSFPAMIGLGNSRCGSTPACVATDFAYDIGSDVDVINQAHVRYTLKLTGLTIAEDQVPPVDLSGIASAEVGVVPTDGSAPVVLATYTRPSGSGRVTTLTADSVADVTRALTRLSPPSTEGGGSGRDSSLIRHSRRAQGAQGAPRGGPLRRSGAWRAAGACSWRRAAP
jgi:hypothetical protein